MLLVFFVLPTASLGTKLTTTSRCASLSKAHNKAVAAHSFLTFTRPRRGVLPVSWENTSNNSPGRGSAKKLFQGENWLRKKRGSTQMRRIFSLLACPVSRCQWTRKIHVVPEKEKGRRRRLCSPEVLWRDADDSEDIAFSTLPPIIMVQ